MRRLKRMFGNVKSQAKKNYEQVESDQKTPDSSFDISKHKGKLNIGLKANVDPEAVRSEIVQDMERGKHRLAVDKAKCYHKYADNNHSEEVLLLAYQGRIANLIDEKLYFEAEQLLEVTKEKFPGKRKQFTQQIMRLALETGQVDKILQELVNADPQAAEGINHLIRCHCTDLSTISNSKVLPAEHPLRIAALAAQEAFAKVTSGKVTDEEIFLPEISRRSPLSDWKLLIRAIALYYQEQDGKALEVANKIQPDSAVYKLSQTLDRLVKRDTKTSSDSSEQGLIDKVIGNNRELEDILSRLDNVITSGNTKFLPSTITRAVAVCRKSQPDLVVRLMQHIAILAMLNSIYPDTVQQGFGDECAVRNAYFWRLFAKALECLNDYGLGGAAWEEFRRHAINEGIIASNSDEEAAIYIHQYDALAKMPREELEDLQEEFESIFSGFGFMYKKQPEYVMRAAPPLKHDNDNYFIFPEKLLERAFKAKPSRELFTKWLDYSKRMEDTDRKQEEIATYWNQSFPADSEPLILLAKIARKRNAYVKGLKYLDQAEEIDSLNPEFKNLRMQLHLSKCMRNLRDDKPHLARKSLEELKSDPKLIYGNWQVILSALDWFLAQAESDSATASATFEQMVNLLGSQDSAKLLLLRLSRLHKVEALTKGISFNKFDKATNPVEALGRVCLIENDLDLTFAVSTPIATQLCNALKKKKSSHDPKLLLAIARHLEEYRNPKLAFYLSMAGLRLGGTLIADFLYIRSFALKYIDETRNEECLRVALTLARRQNNKDIVEKAVNALSYYSTVSLYDCDNLEAGDDIIRYVIASETKTEQFPKRPAYRFLNRKLPNSIEIPFDDECQCEDCRRARGEIPAKKTKKKPVKKSAKSASKEQLLFDDIYDEPDDIIDNGGIEDEDTPFSSLDGKISEDEKILLDFFEFCGNRMPNGKDMGRLVKQNPKLAMKLLNLFAKENKLGNFPDDVFGDEINSDDSPKNSRKNKKKRKNFISREE